MITVQFKIKPTKEQEILLKNTVNSYISSVNNLIDYICGQVDINIKKLSSASFKAALPSTVKNEVVNAVKSILKKYSKGVCQSLPILKKPVATWNNQNYHVNDDFIEFPVIINGKSKRISVEAVITDFQTKKLNNYKHGTLRITQKNGKWTAQIAVQECIQENKSAGTMGVDLGLKIPAVVVTDSGKTKFIGNGRQNKYIKRKHRARRKALGKAKKQKVINKLNNKEQRWMKDQDHKSSRLVVNFAIENNVGIIKLEKLSNIRQTARTSRKNEKNLHTWSFYRLAEYIEYKAKSAGIRVEYVEPRYTSQICPCCGERNHAKDRSYVCKCGYKSHRDRVGAINIISAPVASGKSLSA